MTQSLPDMGFRPFDATSLTERGLKGASNEVLDLVFNAGSRGNELKPFGSINSFATDQERGTRGRRNSVEFGEGERRMEMQREEGIGDGFDLDDVFGSTTTTLYSSFVPSFDETPASQGSSMMISPKKRSHQPEEEREEEEEEDMEMELTDVEDESIAPLPTIRPIVNRTRRGFVKTQSMPILSFSTPF